MEVIPIDNCTKVGYIQKTHSIHGEIVLNFETKYEESIENAEIFFIEQEGLLVPFFLEEDGLRFRSNTTTILKFQWIDSEKAAKLITGSGVYLKTSDIIIPEGIFTIDEYLDFLIQDSSLGVIGKVKEINDYGGNIVLTVMHESNEILIPFNEDLLLSIDGQNKVILLNLPPGLINLEE